MVFFADSDIPFNFFDVGFFEDYNIDMNYINNYWFKELYSINKDTEDFGMMYFLFMTVFDDELLESPEVEKVWISDLIDYNFINIIPNIQQFTADLELQELYNILNTEFNNTASFSDAIGNKYIYNLFAFLNPRFPKATNYIWTNYVKYLRMADRTGLF